MPKAEEPPENLSPRRLLENEQLFRGLNEKLHELTSDAGPAEFDFGEPRVFCECSNPLCRERFPIDGEEYARAHRRADQFTIIPGHEVPEVERVVDQGFGFLIVRKTVVG